MYAFDRQDGLTEFSLLDRVCIACIAAKKLAYATRNLGYVQFIM